MDQQFVERFDLKPLILSDRQTLKPFSATLSQPLAEHTFASWFVWGLPLNIHWRIYKDYLCLFINSCDEVSLFVPPLRSPEAKAEDFADVIFSAFEIMDAWNIPHHGRGKSSIEYVSDQLKDDFAQLQDAFELVQMGTDYVYDMQKMIELPGSALKSKRHAKTKFMRDFPNYRITTYQDDCHKADCIALLNRWVEHRRDQDKDRCNLNSLSLSDLVGRDFHAVSLALDHWLELGLSGMVIYVGDQLAGFTFGEALSETQASILIEKTDPEFPGCPQFLFSEFCRCAWNQYQECNAGDDWGIPNLSFTKMSYRPIKLLPKYMVRYRVA